MREFNKRKERGKMKSPFKTNLSVITTPRSVSPAHLTGPLLCFLLLIFLGGCSYGFRNVPPYEPDKQPNRYNEALRAASALREPASSARGDADYRIHPTDLLDINIFEYEKMNLSTRVKSDGTINFPPLGDLKAAGLTQMELQTQLENRLKGDYLKEPRVLVTIRQAASQNITILGEVRKPGQQAVWGNIRLLDALAQAEGLTDKAGDIAYLVREDPQPGGAARKGQTYRLYLSALLERGEKEWNIPMRPGDTITIPPAGEVHVTGAGVPKGGTYPIGFHPKTALQMVDEAGGLTMGANRDIILARKTDESQDKVQFFKLNYLRALHDSRYDPVMEPQDRLIVRASFWRETMDFTRRVLLTSIFSYKIDSKNAVSVGTDPRFIR